MLVVGAADLAGRIWASLITGEPGFLQTPDPHTLTVAALPVPTDPLAEVLTGPTQIGTIAIEPETRRRMRLNGHSSPAAGGLLIDLDQVISNCPKYLTRRTHTFTSTTAPLSVTAGPALTPKQSGWVTTADTFFIATASPNGDTDASHRGGNPGFIEVLSPTLLRWPDYLGNSMFLTLGNLAVHPAAGLLVPDWETGSVLQLSGSAEVVWRSETDRMIDFRIEAVQESTGVSLLRWDEPEYSRFNPPVGAA